VSEPEGTPERPQDRAPGRRRAVPDKPSRLRGSNAAPTHARPAARPASRAPVTPGYPVLPPSERPPARPAARRRADDVRPYLPPLQDPLNDPLGDPRLPHPVTPVEGRAEPLPQPPVPEYVAPVVVEPAPIEVRTPSPVVAPVETPVPVRRPVQKPATSPPRRRAESRAATARPHARTAAPALPSATTGADRLTSGDGEGWVVLLLLAAFGIVVTRLAPDLPDVVRHVSAIVLSGALAWGLAIRTGGRPFWAAGLSSVLAISAVVSHWHPLMAGAAVGTGVMGATLAVMATTPAATFLRAIREVLIATTVAAIGAIGVVGYGVDTDADIDADRFEYVVLALSLAGTFALVYRLGAGLHGLGRRGYFVAGGAVLMLVFALAYSEAIAEWGSRDLVGVVDDFRDSTRDTLGAVPHPIVALLGYPALVWGVFMRARRRQGWWVCAFGVAATGPVATRLVASDVGARTIVLGGVYSFVIGIVLGYLAIRVEQYLTGSHGRRARRDEEAEAHRPEPRRTRPLH